MWDNSGLGWGLEPTHCFSLAPWFLWEEFRWCKVQKHQAAWDNIVWLETRAKWLLVPYTPTLYSCYYFLMANMRSSVTFLQRQKADINITNKEPLAYCICLKHSYSGLSRFIATWSPSGFKCNWQDHPNNKYRLKCNTLSQVQKRWFFQGAE